MATAEPNALRAAALKRRRGSFGYDDAEALDRAFGQRTAEAAAQKKKNE
jgi:hypothetical protein